MNSSPPTTPFYFFPFFFVGLWLVVTTMLSFLSGWYTLASLYPDRDEPARLTLKGQSGMMGLGVSMSGILILNACPSGLRVGISRLFGPFSRPFFVPWDDIRVQRRRQFFQPMARLGFGRPETGVLRISVGSWERLASEAGLPQADMRRGFAVPNSQLAKTFVVQWVVITAGAACFYYFGPRLMSISNSEGPPIAVCILFPAIFFGVGQIIRYLRQRSG